ncbi:MAG: hypothetical protein IKP47_04240 [Ruminococcus sp.]|nr:hypothetical protein [Ruminococcus sp.]
MNNQIYKPSNKVSVPGLIVLFFGLIVVGFGIYFIYEVLDGWIPLIYLNILLAIGAGFALGGIGGQIVKKFRLRSPLFVLIVGIIALLIANYLRIAVYCSRDYDKNFDKVFQLELWTGIDKTDPKLDPQLKVLYSYIAPLSSDEALEELGGMSTSDGGYADALFDKEKTKTDFKKFIGSSYEEFKQNFLGCETIYDLYVNYGGFVKPTIVSLSTHPDRLFAYLKCVNEDGRWTIKSHRSGLSDSLIGENDNVKGFMLWGVWFFEFLFLTLPAIALMLDKAKAPFVESEGEWAEPEKPMPEFRFVIPPTGRLSTVEGLRTEMMKNAECIFTLDPIPAIAPPAERFYRVTFCRSRYYDENFITVVQSTLTNARKNQRREAKVIKYLSVSADYIATMFGTFEYVVPAMCKGENRAAEISKENKERAQAEQDNIGKPHAPAPPKATGAEAIFDEPSPYSRARIDTSQADSFAAKELERERKEAAAQQPAFKQPTSGDMDSLDTSNLDLSNFDFK